MATRVLVYEKQEHHNPVKGEVSREMGCVLGRSRLRWGDSVHGHNCQIYDELLKMKNTLCGEMGGWRCRDCKEENFG